MIVDEFNFSLLMKIITLNLNGIRAAERKGFFPWLKKQNADFVCFKNLKRKSRLI